MRRVIDNKEPITDGAPIIYTERNLGVLPAYNIRTDRWEIAQAAMEVNQKAVSAQRAKEYDMLLNGEQKNTESGNNDVTPETA